MRIPPFLQARVQALLLLTPPVFGIILGGMLVAGVRALVQEPEPGAPGLPALLAVLSGSLVGVGLFLLGAARVRAGAHTYFPSLWRAVPWTLAGGVIVGVVVVVVRTLGSSGGP